MSSGLSSQNDDSLTVHIFINHDPYLASAFLPSLFNPSSFSNHLWNPPPLTPSQESNNTNRVTPRTSLGRYILPTNLPPTSRISEVATKLEEEFNIHRKYHAYFTIFPATTPDQNGAWPAWHGKPLLEETTLAQAHSYDQENIQERVELVLFTKAAALTRITGTDFIEESLGTDNKRCLYQRLGGYGDVYRPEGFVTPLVVRMLRRWSYACHAGRFLVDKRGRVECTGESDGLCQDGREGAVEVERQVEELRMMKRSAIDEFRELVTQWEEWVLGIVDHDGVEVTDENFEAKWDYLRRSRNELVEAWKASERKADMSKALRGLCHSSPDLWLSDSPDVEDEWEAERFAENENGGQDSSESISETS